MAIFDVDTLKKPRNDSNLGSVPIVGVTGCFEIKAAIA